MPRSKMLALAVVAALAIATLAPASAGASKYLKGPGGFIVRVPNDFRLTYSKTTGVYRLASKKRQARISYLIVDGTDAEDEIVNSFVAQSGGRAGEPVVDEDNARYSVALTRNGLTDIVEGEDLGRGVGLTVRGRTKGATPAALGDLLTTIARNAVGGRPMAIPVKPTPPPVKPIALRPFRTPDGLGAASVPADSDFSCGGVGGAIECYSPRGEATLGVSVKICRPGTVSAQYSGIKGLTEGLCPVVAPVASSTEAMTEVWPRVRNAVLGGGISAVKIVQSAPAFIPGFDSAGMHVATFTRNGQAWTGVFMMASQNIPFSEHWHLYFSSIAVPDSDDSSVGQALAAMWKSWDPSAAFEGRHSATKDQLDNATNIIKSVSAFREKAFERANEEWGKYIRM